MIEVERKYRLTPQEGQDLGDLLRTSYGAIAPIRQVDEVFLKNIDSFAVFKPGMPVMRLRNTGSKSVLTYKRSINDSGDAIEYETPIESYVNMREILSELGFISVTVVDKLRLEAKIEEISVAHDVVKGLGDFLEIEMIIEEESQATAAEKEISHMLHKLGLANAVLELKKYDQLISQ